MGDLRGDAHCAGCICLGYAGGGITCCDYIFKVGKRRPCPPGKDCTVKATQRRLIDGNKAQAVLVNMAEHLLEAGKPQMAGAVGYAAEVIGKQPTVDAVEVVHGRWEFGELGPLGRSVRCPVCGWGAEHVDERLWLASPSHQYCGCCGAKMDGGRE